MGGKSVAELIRTENKPQICHCPLCGEQYETFIYTGKLVCNKCYVRVQNHQIKFNRIK